MYINCWVGEQGTSTSHYCNDKIDSTLYICILGQYSKLKSFLCLGECIFLTLLTITNKAMVIVIIHVMMFHLFAIHTDAPGYALHSQKIIFTTPFKSELSVELMFRKPHYKFEFKAM
jgi:hypothetical protein